MSRKVLSAVAAIALIGIVVAENVAVVDPAIPSYKPVSGVSGSLSSVGSDTLNNLMTYWTEEFSRNYPGVAIQVEGKGSSTAPPALISGTSQLGPMSRAMKGSEIDQFEGKYGYKPHCVRVAVDTLAVFVNKNNPVKSLSIPQVDAIFSKTQKHGLDEINTWGEAGVEGAWSETPISLYGRNSASGTYGFFKEFALENGDYRDTVKEQPGSASVVQSVSVDKNGIGYSGIGYSTSNVRAIPLSKEDGGQAFPANAENAYSGAYPLTRYLYVYINRDPSKGCDPVVKEFIKLVLSKEGQEAVLKDGFYPLPMQVVQEELKALE
ncbi:MAG: phosphate ABC transporter substrate-binding protein [Planctomycetota bacterium]